MNRLHWPHSMMWRMHSFSNNFKISLSVNLSITRSMTQQIESRSYLENCKKKKNPCAIVGYINCGLTVAELLWQIMSNHVKLLGSTEFYIMNLQSTCRIRLKVLVFKYLKLMSQRETISLDSKIWKPFGKTFFPSIKKQRRRMFNQTCTNIYINIYNQV